MSRPHRQLLLIDDDPSVRHSIAAQMEANGFTVYQAESGQQGLDWLQDNRPLAVLTDLRMPDIDGLILEFIRENAPEVPVIVISGVGPVKDVIDALRLGAADYLVKPVVDTDVLAGAIDRALERSELILQNEVYRQELELANRELKEYVRVLERDQKAGRRVQSKLLPEVPTNFGDFAIDFKLVPSLYLSGDFIDFGFVSERYLAFYLTDVSGHGAASAFVTVWLKQLVRRYFRENQVFNTAESFQEDAGKLVGLINKEVIHSGFGCHMTCFVGVIDIQTREMRYVLGGHLPFPILVTPQGSEYLTGKGKPVGIFPDATWKVYSTVLPATFSLVVFSDGILEMLPEGELIEKENFLLSIVKDNAMSVESLSRAFGIAEVESVPDDIAILKVESEKDE